MRKRLHNGESFTTYQTAAPVYDGCNTNLRLTNILKIECLDDSDGFTCLLITVAINALKIQSFSEQ